MTHRVAIVGAGPSGFYAADGLLRAKPDLHVDIVDRLPTPYGLVRAGVAPDHQGTGDRPPVREALASRCTSSNIDVGRDLSRNSTRPVP
jgi:ferredoxin--NADP+ reductase